MRNKEVKSLNQCMCYLVFDDGDVNDFVKEKVKRQYSIAESQALEGNIQRLSAKGLSFKYQSDIYNMEARISFFYDKDGYFEVHTGEIYE